MSLKPQTLDPVPPQTQAIALAAFPKGNLYIKMSDTFGAFYNDALFADLFSPEGSPAQAPWRLALICVMQFAEGLSDRQAAEAVRSRIDWKYALRLELSDAGFDYSVLCQFRQRLLDGQAQLRLLDTLLTLFVEKGLLKRGGDTRSPIKAGGRQRTDSTHVLAAVRTLNRLERVGETLRHALNSLAILVPDWLVGQAPPEFFERYASRMENYRFPKTDKARLELASQIGVDGLLLLSKVEAATTLPWLGEVPAVVILRQVWAEQYTKDQDPPCFLQAEQRPPSAELICSPYDTEARYSTKRDVSWVGYKRGGDTRSPIKVHLSETCDRGLPHLITDVHTTVATTSDENQLNGIQARLQKRALLPKVHLTDAGYPDAETLATSQHLYGVTVLAPVMSDPSWQAKANVGFDRTAFVVDWQAKQVTCPAGKKSQFWLDSTRPAQGAYRVRFAKKDCDACACRDQCTRSPKAPRTLMLQTQEQYQALQEARLEQKTPAFREAYKARAGIEGTHAQAIRRCGLRQARYLGLAKTSLQHILTACALNLVRVGEWLFGTPHAKTRISRFAQLAPAG